MSAEDQFGKTTRLQQHGREQDGAALGSNAQVPEHASNPFPVALHGGVVPPAWVGDAVALVMPRVTHIDDKVCAP